MRTLPHPPLAALDLSQVLHALSDPIRRTIVAYYLLHDNQSCGDVVLPISKSTRSQHFRVLRECGIIWATPDRTRLLVRVRQHDLDTAFPGLLDAVLPRNQ